MSLKKRFLLVTSYTYPEQAGSGINALNFAKHLNKSGNTATLLSFNRASFLSLKFFVDNTSIIRIPYLNQNILLKILWLPVILYWYIIQIIYSDIVIVYGNKIIAYEFIILITKLLNKKVVFRSLLLGVDDLNTVVGKNKLLGAFYKLLFKRIDVYHSINNEFARQFIKHVGSNNKILEATQGVDINTFYPKNNKEILRKKLGLPQDEVIILSVGFLIERKGYLPVFKLLSTLNFKFKYVVLGEYDFSNKHYLRKYAVEALSIYNNGIELLKNKVEIIGFTENCNEFMQCSDFMIHNASCEGLPNVILEAMSCGLPVLTRNLKGLSGSILKHKNNCLVYNNYDELKKYLKQIFSNNNILEELKDNSTTFIRKNSSFDYIANEILEKIYGIQKNAG